MSHTGTVHSVMKQFLPRRLKNKKEDNPALSAVRAVQDAAAKKALYAGIFLYGKGTYAIALRKRAGRYGNVFYGSGSFSDIICWIQAYERQNGVKIFAAGILSHAKNTSREALERFCSDLWFVQDIIPYVCKRTSFRPGASAEWAAKKAAELFLEDGILRITYGKNRKVQVLHLARLADYRRIVSKEDFARLVERADRLRQRGERVVFFSSTPKGGGVALMRHALISFFEELGVSAKWCVMTDDDPRIFHITKKKFHNILQGIAPPGEVLTDEEKAIYEQWCVRNAKMFTPEFRWATTVIIDDMQPSGMIPYVKKTNPSARVLYRSHIHIDTALMERPDAPQNVTWDFLFKNIRLADAFVSHPVPSFVPRSVDQQKMVFMPATTDEFDGLNKDLTPEQTAFYLDLVDADLKAHGQTPLDRSRPYVTQIARFHPSKGIPDVLASYCLLREKLEGDGIEMAQTPQLVIAGHGAVDDPEGVPIFQAILQSLLEPTAKKYAGDIKIARLPPIDQLLNAILSESKIALQLSHKEGFEVKVSEALAKGKPVVAYRTGGIPLQIVDGANGFLVPVGDISQVAEHLRRLITDAALYETMSKNARTMVKREFFTVGNAMRWMELISNVHERAVSAVPAPQRTAAAG